MKKKNNDKKLELNKNTIANLDSTEMNGVRGGTHTTETATILSAALSCNPTCIPCITTDTD